MGILRIYPIKSNTIASGFYQNFNSGQNAITDLWYGGGGSLTDTALEKRNSISRFIMQFDLTDLQNKLNSKQINPALVSSYKLKMKNSIPKDKILEPEYEFNVLNKNIAASFDLICFPLDKNWDAGRGYDLTQENYLVKQAGNPLVTGYSNWNYATSTTPWTQPGVFTDPTGSTIFYATQHFDIGNEDLELDITNIVNNWLSGGSTNFGLGVAYRRDYELLSTDTRFISSFFTNNTNTAYKPNIEVNYNQSFKDDRANITNNRNCKIFLYTFSGANPANFYSASTVTIQNSSGSIVYSGLTPIQVETGVYYVNIWMSGATKGQQFKDIWHGITFNPGYDQQDYTQTFVVQDNYYFNVSPNVNTYSISTYGLDNDSILGTSELIRVYADLRINYSTNTPKTDYQLQYRMVMNNQESVIDWTPVNQALLNKCLSNYFTLDTSWLLHNQTYKIQFRISELGTIRQMPESINFKVLRDF